MIKTLLATLLFLSALDARENPFFPSTVETDTPFTSNENRNKEPLRRAAISIPAEARVLQKVTIEYKNLDGSIQTKSINLDNSIDWHLPIFISQSYSTSILNSSTTEQKNKKNSTKVLSEEINTTAIHTKKESNKAEKISKKNKISTGNIDFVTNDKKIKIITKDSMIRNFILTNPNRIVADFSTTLDVKNETRKVSGPIFKAVKIGNHGDFYRTVIELDGNYKYTQYKTNSGYEFALY
ncbi:AMIN domain-containing protein [Sulfurimonas sp.]|uniref:AMIN domain-containing protein n=1 Tax=Sulfurimonas sp. TaxID=2022749 RepID=UPI0025DF4829|nr:AMIN domain-containing protein [Sulfurimonas sp.]MDD5157631.1 AMIN domain-containing protein [Sulfurimonas sp.]